MGTITGVTGLDGGEEGGVAWAISSLFGDKSGCSWRLLVATMPGIFGGMDMNRLGKVGIVFTRLGGGWAKKFSGIRQHFIFEWRSSLKGVRRSLEKGEYLVINFKLFLNHNVDQLQQIVDAGLNSTR